MQAQPPFSLRLVEKIKQTAKPRPLVNWTSSGAQELPNLAQIERAVGCLLKMAG
jgi:hypothetical protein